MPITVLVAADGEIVRTGLRQFLDDMEDIRIVAEAEDGTQAIASARRLHPDVCLIDVDLPGGPVLELARDIRDATYERQTNILLLTDLASEQQIENTMKSGARGLLSLEVNKPLLVEAVRSASKGKFVLSSSIAFKLMRYFMERPAPPPEPQTPLTTRERMILYLVANGYTNPEIAERSGCALSTVKKTITRCQNKLHARNRIELARWAWSVGRQRTYSGEPGPGAPGEVAFGEIASGAFEEVASGALGRSSAAALR